MMKTNATKTPDARPVELSKQLHVSSASGVFSAFREDSVVEENYHKPQLVDPAATQRGLFVSESAEASDGSPVATLGMDLFRLQVEGAVDQGWIKPASVQHIMAAYSQVAR